MKNLKRYIAETILGVILVGLLTNAWAVYNDVRELKIKEPLTKEDIVELKTDIKNQGKEIGEMKSLLLELKYGNHK